MASTRITAIPAVYAKFITALAGEAIAYVQLYGATWHLEPALVMLGAALAVLGVPNAPAPVVPVQSIAGIRPPEPPGVSTTPPPPARLIP